MCIFHKWTAWESKCFTFSSDRLPIMLIGGFFVPITVDLKLPKEMDFRASCDTRKCVKCGKVQEKTLAFARLTNNEKITHPC